MTVPMSITDLTKEQLREVFDANCQLQDAVKTDSYVWATGRISEILSHFKASLTDFAISSYGVNYLTVSRNEIVAFVDGVHRAHTTHHFLSDEDAATVAQLQQDIAFVLDMEHTYFDYLSLYASIHERINTIAKTISQHFEAVLAASLTEDAIFQHLCDTYIHKSISTAYIELDEDCESDFVLHQTFVRRYDQPEPELEVSA